jgi:hypothetical protein
MATNTNSDESGPRTPPADQDWFGGRRWTGIAAIGFLIVVAVCVLIVVIGRHGSSGPSPPAAGRPAAPAAPAAPLPTAVPTTAPAGTAWTIYETVALPTLPGAGPAHVDGAIATGYARTPLGALLADANESFRYLLAPDGTWRSAAAAMLASSPGTNAWLEVRAKHAYGPAGAAGGQRLAQIAGFQFVSYTPADAVIQVVTRDSKGSLQVGTDHVSWDGTDWRFVPGPDGGQSANVQQVQNLTGFIEWRGV